MSLRTAGWGFSGLLCVMSLAACFPTSSSTSPTDPSLGPGDSAGDVPPEFADEGESEGDADDGPGAEGEGEGEGEEDPGTPSDAGGGAHIPPPLDGPDDPDPVPPLPEPGKECGPGAESEDCAQGRRCDVLGCGGDAVGRCLPAPDGCSGVVRPVCGCDGTNFVNDCERLAAGAARAHEGGCDGGDPCGAELPCPEGFACDLPSCGEGALGACVPRPESCAAVHAPVCGCDGVTYANECQRLAAGAGLNHEGICEAAQGCGPPELPACGEGQACDRRGCAEDAAGACVTATAECAGVSAPVCGCDGALYVNDCERLAAGVAQDDSLGCLEAAGCTGPEDCEDGTTCDLLGCGDAASGACVPSQDACEAVYQLVCGCDGVTYGNDCERRQASVAKASEGPCP